MLAKHPRIVAFVLALVVGMVMLVGQARAADYELDYVSSTSTPTVTATSEATAQSFITGTTITYSGSTPIVIEAFVGYLLVSSGEQGYVALYDGSTAVGTFGSVFTGSGSELVPFYATARITPSAGSHTYSLRLYKGGGTVSAGSYSASPSYIRVTRANFDPTGGGGGSSTLSGLTDVNITSPADGSPLKYDTTSSKWIDGTDNAGSYGGPTWSDFEPWAYIIGAGVWFLFGGLLALIAAPMLQGALRWWRH